jgi:hypothetical protein
MAGAGTLATMIPARCIGCGAPLVAERCATCGTEARGARISVDVRLPQGTPIPPVCACCLAPTMSRATFERGEIGLTRLSKLPVCIGCQAVAKSFSELRIILGGLMAMGAVIAFARLMPGHTGEVLALISVPLAILAVFPLTTALFLKKQPGHVPGCRAARLRRDPQGQVAFTLHNRAFAGLMEAQAAELRRQRGH